jgi:hypothetical protein
MTENEQRPAYKTGPKQQSLLIPWRVNALQGDTEVEREVRHQIIVRKVPGSWAHHVLSHGLILRAAAGVGVRGSAPCLYEYCAAWLSRLSPYSGPINAVDGVSMIRHFGLEQGDGIRASGFAKIVQGETRALARIHRSTSLKVRKPKVAFTVAAIGGPQQREKRRVLGDGHKLTVAKRPSLGSKVEREYPYLGYKRICHVTSSWQMG